MLISEILFKSSPTFNKQNKYYDINVRDGIFHFLNSNYFYPTTINLLLHARIYRNDIRSLWGVSKIVLIGITYSKPNIPSFPLDPHEPKKKKHILSSNLDHLQSRTTPIRRNRCLWISDSYLGVYIVVIFRANLPPCPVTSVGNLALSPPPPPPLPPASLSPRRWHIRGGESPLAEEIRGNWMLTPLPPAALPPLLPSRIRSPSPAHHPRTGLDTRGGEGGRRRRRKGRVA